MSTRSITGGGMSGGRPWRRSVRIFARSCRGEPIGGTARRPLRTRLGSRTPRRGCSTQDPKAYCLRSRKVEAIEVHHLGPRRDEVLDELRLRIRASVDLREGPELGVRTEDEIDARAGPLECARGAIAPFEHVLGVRC